MNPIYLDFNATTPVSEEVADAMLPYLREHFGNPSSTHWYGVQARKAVEKARKQVAALLGCQPGEVIFTSGGSESNNYAVKGYALAHREKGNHLITSSVEHPAVKEVCNFLETKGFEVTCLPVDEYGMVDPSEVEKAIRQGTILITIMHANNEVGTIQLIEEISSIARSRKIVFHTDAAQSAGKIPVRVDDLGVDLLSLAGHKLYAPKGVGALYIRSGLRLEKQIHGASHEQNLRAGTENVLEIVGLGKACEIAARDLEKNMKHLKAMRDRLQEGLSRVLKGFRVNGHPTRRLPNTLSISFKGIEINALLSEIEEVAASAGAACHAEGVEISSVLKAMNVPMEYAMGTARFSTGRETTGEEIDRTVKVVSEAVRRLSPGEEPGLPVFPEREVKLTRFTHGLGCACKLRPQLLDEVLRDFPFSIDKNVLVGTETADDAAVYLLNEQTAIVQTVDFFTPVVDDPYQFGAIAAANSLSDIYAMGAKPLFGLNIVGFPENRLPLQVLRQILLGARDKAQEAGITIIGGHTVEDAEPKYGLAVTGIIHPSRILKNVGARPGDVLILTKPIGLGILTTAMKRGLAERETAELAFTVMATLNEAAAEAASCIPVNACTDITGFGLLGHLKEMSGGSKVDAVIESEHVPILEGAIDFAVSGVIPGGTLANLEYVKEWVEWKEEIPQARRILLADAQTSGGLLFAVPREHGEALLKALKEKGVAWAARIGKFTKPGKGRIFVK